MRDYLYLWCDEQAGRLVASGIEFADLVPALAESDGIVLLEHDFPDPRYDVANRLDFLPKARLDELAKDDIYGYGDFIWADYAGADGPAPLTREDLAALAYFRHMRQPLGPVTLQSLGNRYLVHAHDDSWLLSLFFAPLPAQASLRQLLAPLVAIAGLDAAEETVLAAITSGESAVWLQDGRLERCERTMDIDRLLNARS